MYYTIVQTTDYCSGGMQYVNINKKGDKYVVAYTNKENSETTRKTFDDIHSALNAYERFVEAFVLGLYNYEDRKNWLMDGERKEG